MIVAAPFCFSSDKIQGALTVFASTLAIVPKTAPGKAQRGKLSRVEGLSGTPKSHSTILALRTNSLIYT